MPRNDLCARRRNRLRMPRRNRDLSHHVSPIGLRQLRNLRPCLSRRCLLCQRRVHLLRRSLLWPTDLLTNGVLVPRPSEGLLPKSRLMVHYNGLSWSTTPVNPKKERNVNHFFDNLAKTLAAPAPRRSTLKLLAAAAAVVLTPKKALAANNCGDNFGTGNITLPGGCSGGVPNDGVCAALANALALNGNTCPASCPKTFVISNACRCVTATLAQLDGGSTCACPAGTVTCPSSCPTPGCANCGVCGNACPHGTCCVNGACTSSVGGSCNGQQIC